MADKKKRIISLTEKSTLDSGDFVAIDNDSGGTKRFQLNKLEGGGGGTSDYTDLTNKPQINSVTLSGNKSLADLGISTYIDSYIAANYEDGDSAEY